MRKLTVSFVEDSRPTIAGVIDTLKSTGMFVIKVYKSYDGIDPQDTDLFVLDVDINGSDLEFFQFTRELLLLPKPFIAFTITDEHHGILRTVPGQPKLRDTVFAHGGLGLIPKNPTPGNEAEVTHEDLRFRLLDRIMIYYWSRVG